MKKRFYLLVISLLILNLVIVAQDARQQVLLTIDNKKVTKTEFERIYTKNNEKDTTFIDDKSLEEYLELFINFKLKVIEAEKIGLDTTASFKRELAGYRRQLSKPYLTDKEAEEQLLKEAYERSKTDNRASHILIKLDVHSSPEDTLLAYEKITKIYKRILAGEPFEKVAQEVSEDPAAKKNNGDLGFFTVFQMRLYPFESVAYNTKTGEISPPFRTKSGYHIIKVTDRRKARGQVKVAHIMIVIPRQTKPEDAEKSKEKIFDLYNKLKSGEDFAKLAKEFSDDKGTAQKGGELQWFGTRRMVREFEEASFSLKNKGDFSEPVKTSFGWHIIKLIDKIEIGSFDESKTDLKNKIAKDVERAEKSKLAFIKKLKKEYNFKQNTKNLQDFYKVVDDSIFDSKWDVEQAKDLNNILFTLSDLSVSQQEFAKYLDKYQRKKRKPISIETYVNEVYNKFVKKTIIEYEDKHLEEKYPEFGFLMNEYHDGILLFELTDKIVWSKAIKDTAGLQEFYEKNKTNYMWNDRVDAIIYTCYNENVAELTRKLAEKRAAKGYSDEDILKTVQKKYPQDTVIFETGKFLKGDNNIIDSIKWETGFSENIKKGDKIIFVVINNILTPEPKTLQEAKGLVTADYQTLLEKQWIEELKEKYKVTVNKEVLDSLKD